MERAFLSHSSSDKTLVRSVAKQIGAHHCVYDEYSFTVGCPTLDEIFAGMDATDIFVIFLSEQALKSDWVKREIGEAYKRLSDEKLMRILPIIIDPNIDHHHPLMPTWLTEKYNLRLVTNEMVIYNMIRNSLREANFKHHPRNKELDELFVGRSDELARFERDMNNIEGWVPSYIVTYNFYDGIGRKKFLRNALSKEGIINKNSLPIQISMTGQQSIESFLMQLNAVSDNEDVVKANLSQKSMEEKVKMAKVLVGEIIRNKQIIFIEDNGCIVMPTGKVVGWFKKIAHHKDFDKHLVFCIIAKFHPNEDILYNEHHSLTYAIPELKRTEVQSMFMKLLGIFGMEELSIDDKQYFLDHLRGIPAQIIYAVELMKVSLQDAKKSIDQIDHFADQSSKILLEKIRENDIAYQIAILLSRHEVVSITVLLKIFGDNNITREAIQILYDLSVLRYFFGGYEHVSLNKSLADFIKRSSVQLDGKYYAQFNQVVSKLLKQDLDKTLARDYSEFMMTLQSMLQLGKRIPQKYFIPSLILKDVIMMYDQGEYKRVVKICEELLLETRNYDEQILWQTRYWLTSALSKLKDRKALDYLRFFKENAVVYNFLRGFYYRNIGERNEAMACYDKVLKIDPRHQRSKREKVNILLSWGKYEDAYELAKENYENDKNNIYHIHSYFITLVRRQEYLTHEDIVLLEDLIADMDSRVDHKAEDMVRCMKGEFAYYVKNDLNRARLLLLEAVQLNENKNYPKKSLWDVYKAAKLLHEFGQLGLTGANEGYNVEDYEL